MFCQIQRQRSRCWSQDRGKSSHSHSCPAPQHKELQLPKKHAVMPSGNLIFSQITLTTLSQPVSGKDIFPVNKTLTLICSWGTPAKDGSPALSNWQLCTCAHGGVCECVGVEGRGRFILNSFCLISNLHNNLLSQKRRWGVREGNLHMVTKLRVTQVILRPALCPLHHNMFLPLPANCKKKQNPSTLKKMLKICLYKTIIPKS